MGKACALLCFSRAVRSAAPGVQRQNPEKWRRSFIISPLNALPAENALKPVPKRPCTRLEIPAGSSSTGTNAAAAVAAQSFAPPGRWVFTVSA